MPIFDDIWHEVHGHSPSVDPLLVQSWVRDTWREIAEYRSWSWLRKKSIVTVPTPYTTGTVTLTPGSPTAVFSGATLDVSMIGRQFRVGLSGSIYEITAVDPSASTAQLFPAWTDTTAVSAAQSYKIFTAYITPPSSDFFAWIAVKDPARRKRLRLHINNETIDYYDATRSMAVGSSGGPSCLSGIDWTSSYSGRVYSTLQVYGTGPKPTASGSYSGQTDSLFVIKITVGGAVDAAQFSWQKDSGTVYSGTTVSSAGNILPEDVNLQWPSGIYVLGDIFIIRTSSRPQYGQPRYEIYPHPLTSLFLPCTYTTRVQEIDDPSFVLPYTMRSDVIKCGTLAKMAGQYPGTDQKPNPFSQIARAQRLDSKYQQMLGELATADDYIMETNVLDPTDQWELALLPWMSTSGSGLRPTQDYDPRDMLII